MKKLLIILFLLPVLTQAQLVSLVIRNDTLFGFNPLTGIYTQYTKLVPPIAGQSGKYLTNNGTDLTTPINMTAITSSAIPSWVSLY